MAKASTYIKDIRAQVRADHGGKVPDHLNLTIRNYANALVMVAPSFAISAWSVSRISSALA